MAVNGNIPGNPIFDASGVNDTEITLSTGVTDHITVDLGLDVTNNADEVYNGGATTSANTTLTATALALTDASIVFEGATADAHETTLTVTDPTADRTITLPNETGTLITSASAATNAFSISMAAALG